VPPVEQGSSQDDERSFRPAQESTCLVTVKRTETRRTRSGAASQPCRMSKKVRRSLGQSQLVQKNQPLKESCSPRAALLVRLQAVVQGREC
jgi:hypothetical protein